MAITQSSPDLTSPCPHCSGHLVLEHHSWQCPDCGHAPNHGAD